VELSLTGTPLDMLQEAFLDLTSRLEAKVIDLDGALRELQSKEVIDATGHAWRIDPVTRSFVRRAPGPDASWLPATPADFVAPGEGGVPPGTTGPQAISARPIAQGGQAVGADARQQGTAAPMTRRPATPEPTGRTRALVPIPRVPGRFRSISWRWYAAGGAAVVVVATVVVTAASMSGSKDPARPALTAKTTAPSAQAGVVGQGFPVPDSGTCSAAIAEIASGDPARIARVADSGQYGPGDRKLFAATYAGWSASGLTVKPELAVGTANGLTATQVWELRDHGTVIGVAAVTWTRANTGAPWRLAAWPAFNAPS